MLLKKVYPVGQLKQFVDNAPEHVVQLGSQLTHVEPDRNLSGGQLRQFVFDPPEHVSQVVSQAAHESPFW